MDAADGYRFLVTLDNLGAAIERIELVEQTKAGHFAYRSLQTKNIGGYLGESTIRITTNLQETSRDLAPANKEILVLDDTLGDASTAAINGVSISVVSTTV